MSPLLEVAVLCPAVFVDRLVQRICIFLGNLSPERVWVISIARLRALPPVDLQPIDVIVFDDPYVEILS